MVVIDGEFNQQGGADKLDVELLHTVHSNQCLRPSQMKPPTTVPAEGVTPYAPSSS